MNKEEGNVSVKVKNGYVGEKGERIIDIIF